MGRRRLTLAAVAAAAVGLSLALLARPRQFVVEGHSMGPGLLPGDRVATGPWPLLDRRQIPRRFERWIVAAPDDTPALKRVVGLPGEVVSIRGGDLVIDGQLILAPPVVLVETATCVNADVEQPAPSPHRAPALDTSIDEGNDDAWHWQVDIPEEVLDDAAFAPHERRLLLPVRDVGLAAIVRVAPVMAEAMRLGARIDDRRIVWRLAAPGRYAIVAGRLDGHLVGAAWPLDATATASRGCLPPLGPAAWDVALPWPGDGPPQTLTLEMSRLRRDEAAQYVERLGLWRDRLLRPAADQVEEWRLGTGEYFLLGDFPSGSRDSRHWGPLDRGAFRHRIPRER